MAVQLRSGREMSNNRAEEKEKTNKKEEKATGGDHGKSMTDRTTEIENQVQTEQPEKSSEQKHKAILHTCSPISIEDSEGKEGRTIF